jgi:hypothetical protein
MPIGEHDDHEATRQRLREKTIELRIEAAQEAQRRSRIAFSAATIVSLAMIIAGWNAYFSWNRDIAFAYAQLPPTGEGRVDKTGFRIEQTGAHVLQREVISEWVKSRMVTVGLLGIRVGIDDAPQLGALALLVINIWFFYTVRGENYTIGYLLRDTVNESPETRWMVFHGIISYSVFTLINNSDKPVDRLKGPRPLGHRVEFARAAYRILFYFPPISVVLLILSDVLSVFYLASPFRDNQRDALWRVLGAPELWQAAFWWLVALVLSVLIARLSSKIGQFNHVTEKLLGEYLDGIPKNDTDNEGVAPS